MMIQRTGGLSAEGLVLQATSAAERGASVDKELHAQRAETGRQLAKTEREKLTVLQQQARAQRDEAEHAGGIFNLIGRLAFGLATLGTSLAMEAVVDAARGKKFDLMSGGLVTTLGGLPLAGAPSIAHAVSVGAANRDAADADADAERAKLDLDRATARLSDGFSALKDADTRSGELRDLVRGALEESCEASLRVHRRL